jgi:hypothetical protein
MRTEVSDVVKLLDKVSKLMKGAIREFRIKLTLWKIEKADGYSVLDQIEVESSPSTTRTYLS